MSFLRPWTAAGESLEICRPESLQVLLCYQLSHFFFSPYTSPRWLFPNQPLNMVPVLLPEDLTYLFNEATILQLSHQHSPAFQTNPWFRRAISLSFKKTLFPWPLDFDSACILTSSDIPFNSDCSPQIQFCMSAGLRDTCAECHDITEFPDSMLRIELTIYHNPLPVWLSPTRFPWPPSLTAIWPPRRDENKRLGALQRCSPHGQASEPQAAAASLQTSRDWTKT